MELVLLTDNMLENWVAKDSGWFWYPSSDPWRTLGGLEGSLDLGPAGEFGKNTLSSPQLSESSGLLSGLFWY